MLLALVGDEGAGGAPSPPLVDEEMEQGLMGREEVAPPVALELPSPGEPSSDEWRHHVPTQIPIQAWCNVCVRARGREDDHKSNQAHPSINATTAS